MKTKKAKPLPNKQCKPKTEYRLLTFFNGTPSETDEYQKLWDEYTVAQGKWIDEKYSFFGMLGFKKPQEPVKPIPNYTVGWFSNGENWRYLNEALPALSQEGWELAFVREPNSLIFKRAL